MSTISRNKFISAVFILGVLAVSGWATAGYQWLNPPTPVTITERQFEGQQIVVQTESGLQEEQFYYYGEKFENLTGCKVLVSPTPVGATYEKLITEFVAGTGAYDVIFLIPMWMGDIYPYLLSIDDYILEDDPALIDIMATFRDSYMKWGDHYYGVTFDGDVFNVYYRKDMLQREDLKTEFKAEYGYELKVPETWNEYLDIATFLTEKGGGESWGTAEDCIKGEAIWWFINRFAGYGGRFFDPETMEPEINSPAGVKALENMIACVEVSPPGTTTWGCTEVRGAFYRGDLGMFMDWPDPGIEVENPALSSVTGKCGFAMVPGSREVWNNDEERWVKANDLPEDIKKNYVYNGVYHSASLGYGCALCITKTCEYPDAAYAFIRYITSPKISLEIVEDKYALSGIDPFRYSHIKSSELRERTPSFDEFLAVEQKNILCGYPDLRIKATEHYMDILHTYMMKAIAGEMSANEALDTIASEWNALTNDLGKNEQLAIWMASPHTPYGP